MKHIKKYNESKKDYTDLVTSFIDEVSAVFDNDKWGIIEKSYDRNLGDYYEFELKNYQKYPDIVFSKILDGFDSSTKHPFISIGIECDYARVQPHELLKKINQNIELLTNIKRLLKNLEYLDIYAPYTYEYVSYDLLSLRIDLKWYILKDL